MPYSHRESSLLLAHSVRVVGTWSGVVFDARIVLHLRPSLDGASAGSRFVDPRRHRAVGSGSRTGGFDGAVVRPSDVRPTGHAPRRSVGSRLRPRSDPGTGVVLVRRWYGAPVRHLRALSDRYGRRLVILAEDSVFQRQSVVVAWSRSFLDC